MGKGTFRIIGERFDLLWRGKKSRSKIADELHISPSSVTSYSRPGIHNVNIEKAEEWSDDVRAMIGYGLSPESNGVPADPPDPARIREGEKDATDAVARLFASLPPEERNNLRRDLAALTKRYSEQGDGGDAEAAKEKHLIQIHKEGVLAEPAPIKAPRSGSGTRLPNRRAAKKSDRLKEG